MGGILSGLLGGITKGAIGGYTAEGERKRKEEELGKNILTQFHLSRLQNWENLTEPEQNFSMSEIGRIHGIKPEVLGTAVQLSHSLAKQLPAAGVAPPAAPPTPREAPIGGVQKPVDIPANVQDMSPATLPAPKIAPNAPLTPPPTSDTVAKEMGITGPRTFNQNRVIQQELYKRNESDRQKAEQLNAIDQSTLPPAVKAQYKMQVQGLKGLPGQAGADASMLRAGFKRDEVTGEIRPLTISESSEQTKSLIDYRKAVDGFKQAQLDINKARLVNNTAMVEVAKRNAAAHEEVARSLAQRAGLAQDTFDRDTTGLVRGEAIEGGPTGETGQPIGWKAPEAKLAVPTAGERMRDYQAKAIKIQGRDLGKFMLDHIDEIGPAMGRVGKYEDLAGIQSPAVAELVARLSSFANLQPFLHGARGFAMLQEFVHAGPQLKDNPAAFQAKIDGLMDAADAFSEAYNMNKKIYHKGGAAPAKPGINPPPATAPAAGTHEDEAAQFMKKHGL